MSEQLIYAMSAFGGSSLTKFNEIAKRLCPPDERKGNGYNLRSQLVRSLESLGYCEFDYDQRQVYMCPPAFVLLPSFGLPRALLTGARTQQLVEKIKRSVKAKRDRAILIMSSQKQTEMDLPDAIIVETSDKDVLKEIAIENNVSSNIERPAAWDLANQSISIDDVEKGLGFESRSEINWSRRDFNVERLGFSSSKLNGQCRLSEYINPTNQQRRHWLWKDGLAADVSRDWGRYIVLRHERKRIYLYDEEAQEFQIPLWIPLPCLLSRAVTLCSGMAPIICDNGGRLMQVYSDVPMEIAKVIAMKIGQDALSEAV